MRTLDVELVLPLKVFAVDGALLVDTVLKLPLSINVPDAEPPIVKVFLPPPKIVIPPRRTVKRVERGEHGEITRIVEEQE